MIPTYIVFLVGFGLLIILGVVGYWSYTQFEDDKKKKTGMSNVSINDAPGFHQGYGCAQHGCSTMP